MDTIRWLVSAVEPKYNLRQKLGEAPSIDLRGCHWKPKKLSSLKQMSVPTHARTDASILRWLRGRKRTAVFEHSVESGLFLLAGVILTSVIWYLLYFIILILLMKWGYPGKFWHLQNVAWWVSLTSLLTLALSQRIHRVREEFNPPYISKWSTNVVSPDFALASSRTIIGLFVSGPRCLVLSVVALQRACLLLGYDLREVSHLIEVGLTKPGKVLQSDIPEYNLEWIVRDVSWLHGVVLLSGPPRGFIITKELRKEILMANGGSEIPPPAQPSPESADEDGFDETELWAFEILSVTPGSSKEEIRSAYRKAAKVFHPDVAMDQHSSFRTASENKMKNLNEAYQILMSSR